MSTRGKDRVKSIDYASGYCASECDIVFEW